MSHVVRCLLAALASVAWLATVARAQTAQPVDLELVLAVDTSTSVDAQEFALQTQGLAEAFLHPDVVNAIRLAGRNGVAINVVHWAGPGAQATAVDWFVVRDSTSAAALSRRIAATTRALNGMTDIAGVLQFSMRSILSNDLDGARRVIDVSGDGTGDAGKDAAARDAALAQGIVVNGLVINNVDYSLGELANIDLYSHYRDYVIGGPGAFLMTAKDYDDFRVAIRRKLVREIIGPVSAGSD
jgi:pyruvate/2-oxoacid:ferredoxin oxidoreductase beta subunit